MIRLKEKRQERNLTQHQLSEKSGVAQSYISEVENERYACTIDVLCKLCKALEVTPNDLIKKEYWDI